jgi:hypothetical protein
MIHGALSMTRTLLVSCAGLFVLSQQLDAVCLKPPPPCEALAKSQVVFYAEVQEVTPQPDIPGTFPRHLLVRFNVLRAFKGAKEGPLLETFDYGVDAVSFEGRRRYLVYATREPGGFLTVTCSRTTWLVANPEALLAEVDELAACSKTP